jgi:hypothetical protein
MTDKKQLLDKDGNAITKEIVEEKLCEIYGEEPMKPLLEKCEWEEDGEIYHTWKINSPAGSGYTNDAGAAQVNKAIEDWVKKEYGKED